MHSAPETAGARQPRTLVITSWFIALLDEQGHPTRRLTPYYDNEPGPVTVAEWRSSYPGCHLVRERVIREVMAT